MIKLRSLFQNPILHIQNTLVVPQIKARDSFGQIFELPNKIKAHTLLYIGSGDDDFGSVYRYLRKYFEYDKITTLHIDTNKITKNVNLNNLFFTASKMEIHKLINFKNKYQADYFLLSPNDEVITSFKKPINSIKKLQQMRMIINSPSN